MQELIYKRISKEMSINEAKVIQTAALLDEGNTIPFVARYRKEMTGGLTDEEVRLLQEKLTHYRNLEERRQEVLRLIDAQDALSPELQKQVEKAATVTELDDLYRPYRPKRRTRASVAREKGLDPFALALLEGKINPETEADKYIDPDKELPDTASVLRGVSDIVAEVISDDAAVRKSLRNLYSRLAGVTVEKKAASEENTYDDYAGYREPLAKIKSHRVLAINRGVKEKALDLKLEIDEEKVLKVIGSIYISEDQNEACREFIQNSSVDSLRRLIHPSLEREVWQGLLDGAVAGALVVFKENLKKRLLVPPVRRRRVMGWDPGFRTGCKLACISETGQLLETAAVFPTAPKNDLAGASSKVLKLIEKHKIDCIAIGNGTASRESEAFIANLIKEKQLDLEYTIVNEAGASVYSASRAAQKEFSDLDVAERSAVSIARRLQDPLAELVKIDPKAIGVGQYQHDMPPKELDTALDGTVESCVNNVGVELNNASAALLSYVAGINSSVAVKIIDYRQEIGAFKSREQLLDVSGLGPKVFKQCAGFLRLPDSDNFLERSAVHPESYELAGRVMDELSIAPANLGSVDLVPQLLTEDLAALAVRLDAGEPTIRDILDEFRRPGRDPREDLPKPVFLQSITELDDLEPGMILMGIVRNIVDFGAFIDIGVHHDGLVHISEIADRYIQHPLEVLQIESVVRVKILSIDRDRNRIALSIKQAGEQI
ncbi:MAG: RNA-binding transcriptional accessory protein [Firmicutes bacterium]|nr:RNA-binding transcriptional accessory protein [Bacillota bacterium]